MGRLARDGQSAPTVAYYLMADSGADPKMAEVLDLKNAQALPIKDVHAKVLSALPDAGDRMKHLAEDVLRQAGLPIPVCDDQD